MRKKYFACLIMMAAIAGINAQEIPDKPAKPDQPVAQTPNDPPVGMVQSPVNPTEVNLHQQINNPDADAVQPEGASDFFDNTANAPEIDPGQFGMKWAAYKSYPKKHYHVFNCDDKGVVYDENANPQNCFFVISKREFRIYVYEKVGNDIRLVAHFPVCTARNTGDKHRSGDGTTPVCAKDRNGEYIPFTITQIAAASSWKHDFHDGRGNIPAYGDWFMRLKLNSHPHVPSNTSIGIHGSSSNELSVPGRDSEGCIRLRNADLNKLRKFARVGTKVIIKPENVGKLQYEKLAQERLGAKYQAQRKGLQLPSNAIWINQ